MDTTAYVTTALEREIHAVRSAREGGRAEATFRAAAAIGGFVGGGYLGEEDAEALLVAAATATGLTESQARAHVRRGLRQGAKTPRMVPASTPPATNLAPSARPAPPPPRPPAPLCHPPAAEVAAVWARCIAVTRDIAITEFLNARELDPDAVALWDLARALPRDTRCPAWASSAGFSWTLTGHRLLFRCWDADGRFASLRARRLQHSETSPKNLAPKGYTTNGLVLADPLGVQLLQGSVPSWWTAHEVALSEGETDWLTWTTRQSDAHEQGPACLGIWAGGWTTAIAARIPTGAAVAIRTDADEAGDRYAQQVAASLLGRCTCYRPRRERAP